MLVFDYDSYASACTVFSSGPKQRMRDYDGKAVTPMSDRVGKVGEGEGTAYVHINWCRELPDNTKEDETNDANP